MVQLKRELGLVQTTFAGIGIILGAGIYALIGIAAGATGNTIWLSFLIATVVALFSGLSYAELSSKYDGDGGEYTYCEKAFGHKVAWVVALFTIFIGVVSAATVALGFAGYIGSMIPIPYMVGALGIIAIMSFLNYWGIKDSNRFNMLSTSIEFIGLLIIIVLGIGYYGTADIFARPQGWEGVFKAGALVFFSFMGFETIVKLREETKNPQRTIPLAIIISIVITAIVYVLVSIAAVNLLPADQLATSSSPLADVAAVRMGGAAFIVLAIIALFSTSNTVLLTMLTTSRLVYGMGSEGSLPKRFAKISVKRHTPHIAVLVTGIVTALLALIGNIELVANITSALLFGTFALINLATIVLRYKEPRNHATFKMPLNIGKFPVLAAIGVIISLVMLVFSFTNIF